MLKRILNILRHPNRLLHRNTCDNEHFVAYLRSKGAVIGSNTRFISPANCAIDPGRLDYIRIGENCCLSVVTILAHDYSWYTLVDAYNDILPDSGGEVIIGSNVFVGYQACILKDTCIGDNVIIGARSVVKGNIPSNTVWAGVPARQICTLEEYYNKKNIFRITDSIKRREHIKKKKGREPLIEEMGLFAFLFLPREMELYDKYIKNIEYNGVKNSTKIKELFFSTIPFFMSYEEFLAYNENE